MSNQVIILIAITAYAIILSDLPIIAVKRLVQAIKK